MQPDVTHIANLVATVNGVAPQVEESSLGALLRVSAEHVSSSLRAIQAEGFGFLVDLFGSDTGEQIEVTYHVRSLGRDEDLFVRATLPYDGTLASVWEVYPAGAFPERELAELYGVRLSGHPNPTRLLTTAGRPPYLRKDVLVRGAEEVRLRERSTD